jgi:hypothetical protein
MEHDAPIKRIFANMPAAAKQEFLGDLNYKENQFFDYEKYPQLKSKWNEWTKIGAHERFKTAFRIIMAKASKEENRNKIYVCISHGCAIESQLSALPRRTHQDYCGVTLLEPYDDPERKILWNLKMDNYCAWGNHGEIL